VKASIRRWAARAGERIGRLVRRPTLSTTDAEQRRASQPPSTDPAVAQYLALTRELPRPTPSQMEAFALHVSGAHSWYKHLPWYPPGKPFYIYLDPAAGMERRRSESGDWVVSDRQVRGFHYSWLPTADYLDQFGHLAFAQAHATVVSLRLSDGTRVAPSDDSPTYHDPLNGQLRPVPEPILAAGTAMVSAIIYTSGIRRLSSRDTTQYGIGHRALRGDARKLPHWPEESGGRAALIALSEARNEDELCDLLEPERTRQLREIVRACERVVAAVHADAPRTAALLER
jgi:hypothetical protein